MVELGKYAGAVLSAYGVTMVLLVLLMVATWRRSVKVKAALDAAEERQKKNG